MHLDHFDNPSDRHVRAVVRKEAALIHWNRTMEMSQNLRGALDLTSGEIQWKAGRPGPLRFASTGLEIL